MIGRDVSDREIVRKNVEIFKLILQKVSELPPVHKKNDLQAPSILIFLHKIQGEVRFFDHYTEPLNPAEWSCIRCRFSPALGTRESFHLEISNVDDKYFSWEELRPEAFSRIKDTIKTIRFITRFLPKRKNFPVSLKEFSQTNIGALPGKTTEFDILGQAFYDLSRTECERKLEQYETGTFLFRKDEFAEILEEQLSLAKQEPIECITLSYLAPEAKICDITLIRWKDSWTIYDDDPELEGEYYPSLYSLLESSKHNLQSPLLHSPGLV